MRKLTIGVAALVLVIVLGTMAITSIGAQQPEQSYNYREWYLQNLWQLQHDDPDNGNIVALTGLTDTMIDNFIIPNTGETREAAKARLSAALGGSPTSLRLYTAAVVESYTVADCSNYYQSQCFMLEVTHWAIAIQILWPLGTAVGFDIVLADDYAPEWAMWDIPRPSGGEQYSPPPPSLPLAFDPDGPDRDCSDFTNWQDAQAFFWATDNDSHDLDPDGDGVACEDLPGAPQSEVQIREVEVVVTPTPVAGTYIAVSGTGTATRNIELIAGLWIVQMDIQNNCRSSSGQCRGTNFIVQVESVDEDDSELLANEIAAEWTGSKTFRVGGDGFVQHAPGSQIVSVKATGTWSITFTKQ